MASKISQLLSVRLGNDVLARIDEVSKTLPVVPGIKVTRSATARMLLLRALEAIEAGRPIEAHQQPARQEPDGESSNRDTEEDPPPLFEGWAY